MIETVFLDRDGTINRKAPEGEYVSRVRDFEFLPGAQQAIRMLNGAGMRVIVVTNQRGVALGRMSVGELERIHRRMLAELCVAGASVDAVYTCCHDHGCCDCRKPDVGMFLAAKRDFPEIEFACAAIVGDGEADMEAGARLGLRRLLVDATAHATRVDGDLVTTPSLRDAAALLVSERVCARPPGRHAVRV